MASGQAVLFCHLLVLKSSHPVSSGWQVSLCLFFQAGSVRAKRLKIIIESGFLLSGRIAAILFIQIKIILYEKTILGNRHTIIDPLLNCINIDDCIFSGILYCLERVCRPG